jgi:hypothetical protein
MCIAYNDVHQVCMPMGLLSVFSCLVIGLDRGFIHLLD